MRPVDDRAHAGRGRGWGMAIKAFKPGWMGMMRAVNRAVNRGSLGPWGWGATIAGAIAIVAVGAARPAVGVDPLASPRREPNAGDATEGLDARVDRLRRAYGDRRPVGAIATGLDLAAAGRLRDRFVASLVPQWGPVVGYKAALTNPAVQARFGMTQPVRGMLLRRMLYGNGAVLSAQVGARPVLEADLMVRVGSDAINDARNDRELLAALDAVVPFVEVPDLVYAPTVALDGPAIVAINAGARAGVLGDAIALEPTAAWGARLGAIAVTVLDGTTGATLGNGTTAALLGHPLAAVRWLRDDLRAAGLALKPGDLLSLGTIAPPVMVRPGLRAIVRYGGLSPQGHPVEVTVSFR